MSPGPTVATMPPAPSAIALVKASSPRLWSRAIVLVVAVLPAGTASTDRRRHERPSRRALRGRPGGRGGGPGQPARFTASEGGPLHPQFNEYRADTGVHDRAKDRNGVKLQPQQGRHDDLLVEGHGFGTSTSKRSPRQPSRPRQLRRKGKRSRRRAATRRPRWNPRLVLGEQGLPRRSRDAEVGGFSTAAPPCFLPKQTHQAIEIPNLDSPGPILTL